MHCCKCLWQNNGSFDDMKMYRLPDIKDGKVRGYDTYCEDCAKEWLEEHREEDGIYEGL